MDLLKSISVAARDPFARTKGKVGDTVAHHRVIFWSGGKSEHLAKYLKPILPAWQVQKLEDAAVQSFNGEEGVVWILRPDFFEREAETLGHGAKLNYSEQGVARDLCGSWLRTQKVKGHVDFEFAKATDREVVGSLLGLGLAQYKFLEVVREKKMAVTWKFFEKSRRELKSQDLTKAVALLTGMNLARHLTNLPAGVATPQALGQSLSRFFKNRKGLKVEVWGIDKLKKEKMGLLLGVGHGSATGARMVRLCYRPPGSLKQKPLAFVGKGVTFDTGGLDIKPASAMRLMKKDMAGAAALAGLCHFATMAKLKVPCDFYLPFAENAVSDRATRPGDVHESRSGHLVEIDNTDAEGRLVMADAIDVAVTQKGADAPAALFDISTLTGAMRVAVGLDVAGFFANDDKLAKEIEASAQTAGEMAWRMPLVQKYAKQLSSSFADFKNSTDSGFGGAITAALFLEKFIRKTPWVHFDVMSWNNSGDGALSDGANGQCYQILAELLLGRE